MDAAAIPAKPVRKSFLMREVARLVPSSNATTKARSNPKSGKLSLPDSFDYETMPSGSVLAHLPRVKSGTSTLCPRFATDHSESGEITDQAAAS